MGNNASTQAGGDRGGGSGSARSSRQHSPRNRTVSLPPVSQPNTSTSSSHRTSRKKSLDMPDVSSSSHSHSHSTSTSSASSSRRSTRSFGGSIRRKGSDRVPVVDEEPDPDEPLTGGGSLRGALQGKAEHVVYGPRRDEDEGVDVDVPTMKAAPGGRKVRLLPDVGGKVTAAPSSTNTAAAATAMAIPGASSSGGGTSARTPAGGLLHSHVGRDGSLTNAGMGAIGASVISSEEMDPDDTTHPGFSTAPRLTSAVMMSSERMPVVNSPKREEAPEESPFGGSGDSAQGSGEGTPAAAAAEGGERGGRTPTQDQPAGGAGGGGGGEEDLSSKVPSGDLAAIDFQQQHQGGPTTPSGGGGGVRSVVTPQTSFAGAASTIFAPAPSSSSASSSVSAPTPIPSSHLLPPHTASPSPPSTAPADTVLAPAVPASALPLDAEHIPSGTSVIASPASSQGSTPVVPSPAVLLPPAVLNAPVAAIPIPLLSVPSPAVAQSLVAAAVDLGAGEQGVPTLIKWRNEDGQVPAQGGEEAKGPREVFVTGTFAKGWKTKIELRKTDPSDFSALISLPPGPHRLKFIVDNEWKASKHLPVATDADGNLINYLQVNPINSKIPIQAWQPVPGSGVAGVAPGVSAVATVAAPTHTPVVTGTPTRGGGAGVGGPGQFPGFQAINGLLYPFASGVVDDDEGAGAAGGADAGWWGDDDPSSRWTQDIPRELEEWGIWEQERDQIEADFYALHPNGPSSHVPYPDLPPPPPSAGVPPPTLPAQLEKGPLNHAAYVTQGSGDDNSILPKPDHSVINHLAASPIKGGFLSVGVTTRYKRKFVTIVYYKALESPDKN